MITTRLVYCLAAAMGAAVLSISAQADWLPLPVRDRAADRLAERAIAIERRQPDDPQKFRAGTRALPVSTAPVDADAERFRTTAQAVVNAFAAEVTRARGGALADVPTVEIRNTPQLIFFTDTSNTITVPWWETQPAGMRAVFRTFAGGGDAEAERLFRGVLQSFPDRARSRTLVPGSGRPS